MEWLVGEGFHFATRFLQDRVSRRLWTEKSRGAGLAFFLTELGLETGALKNDGAPPGLLSVSAELAVRKTGQT